VSVRIAVPGPEISNRWPHIGRFPRVDSAGGADGEFHGWEWWVRDTLRPADRAAAAYEEWAEFYEWRLEQCPDLEAVSRAIVAEILADLDRHLQPVEALSQYLRKVG
jgi:hypothetical protein